MLTSDTMSMLATSMLIPTATGGPETGKTVVFRLLFFKPQLVLN